MKTNRLWGLLGMIVLCFWMFVGSASPTLAAWCWCKTNGGTCENHIQNDATPPQDISSQDMCNRYCSGRGAGWQATNFDTVWIDRAGPVIQDRCPDPNARRSQTANSNNSGSASSEATAPARQDLYNPLGADVTIPDVIGRIIRAITGVIGSIALLAFVYGGIRWMTAYTDAGVEVARNTLKNAFIGLLLIFFAYTLSSLLLSLFSGQ